MIRHDFRRRLSRPRWGLGHTYDVASTLLFTIHKSMLKYALEGCLVSGRVGVHELFCGMKSNVVFQVKVEGMCPCSHNKIGFDFFRASGW